MTMRTAIVLVLIAISMASTAPIEYYSSIDLDTIDTEKMVTVPESLRMLTDCFLDKGPCNDIGAKIKKVIPESVKTACEKCSPTQKHTTKRYFEELTRQHPEDLAAFNKKYDPEYKYFFNFLSAVKDA